ncbi:hypothetical protein ACFE04_012974 [Oxalis oulophora]
MSNGSIFYGKEVVGDIKIGNGNVNARKTKTFNVTVDVRSYRLSSNKSLSDAMNYYGIVDFSSFVVLKGRIHLFDILKIRKITTKLYCRMSLDLRTQTIFGLAV